MLLICGCFYDIHRWLEEVREIMLHNTFEGDEALSWAAYHASCQPSDKDNRQGITSLLPLFYDEAKSVAMIRHSMDVVKQALEILNPAQVPVVTFDQPLYAIAKNIQWSWPESHGENHFVVMFGGLHIEMTALKVIIYLVSLIVYTCICLYMYQLIVISKVIFPRLDTFDT